MAKPPTFPKSLGACADLLFAKRQARLEADRAALALKAEELALIEHIINSLDKDSGGAVGKTHKVTVVVKQKPQVADWAAFHEYVRKNKAFELLQKRLSEAAIQERLDDGKRIPGVELFNAVTVSLTKK